MAITSTYAIKKGPRLKGPCGLDDRRGGAHAEGAKISGCDDTTFLVKRKYPYQFGTHSRKVLALRGRLVRGPEWAAPQKTPTISSALYGRPTFRQRLVKVRLVTKGPGPDHKRMTAPSGTGLLRMV